MKKAYLFALTVLAIPVMADNYKGFYVGIGVSSVNDKQDHAPVGVGSDGMDDTSAIRTGEIFGGYKYNDALGLEIRVGKGLRPGMGDTYNFSGTGGAVNITGQVERDIGAYESIYYKPELVNEDAKLYALLGYTHMSTSKTTIPLAAQEVKESNVTYSGGSYGIGIGFVINENLNINFEYKNICDKLYNKPNTTSVNFDYRF